MAAREVDRLAGRSEGLCALIESRDEGETNLGEKTVASYANVFGVPLVWLRYGFGDQPPEATIRQAVASARRRRSRTKVRTGTDG